MAYLKTHYYPSFISVLMSQNNSNTGYLKELVEDAQSKGVTVYPPDIHRSTLAFIPHQSGILAPLTIIKGIGASTARKLMELRPFNDYADFKEKVGQVINEKYIESLIHANALDGFNLNHAVLLEQNNLSHTGFEQFLDDYQKIDLEELPFSALKSSEIEVLGFNLKYVKDETVAQLNKKTQFKSNKLE